MREEQRWGGGEEEVGELYLWYLGPQILILLGVLQKVDKLQYFHFSLLTASHMPGIRGQGSNSAHC